MEDNYIVDNGTESLANINENYFFFYSRIPNYHKSEPILTYSDDDFEVRMFETAQVISASAIPAIKSSKRKRHVCNPRIGLYHDSQQE